ncbi:MAG: hypothetical protein CUN56_03445 [Phototrophicales bacterium]|nr:MAG: hypothetical protein CUN56_03445 [Phototrophicales bacterium]
MPAINAQEDTPQTPEEICAAATPAPDAATQTFTAPDQVLEPGVDYYAIFCTEYGPIYVNLFETLAPQTVNSFVFLAQNNFYNNTVFHRVIADFMAQGGDPEGTGRGGPGYTVNDEYVSYMVFDRPGLLATANSNNRDMGRFNTNGSQFFITTVVTDWLNYNHTIFGEVLYGQENVEAIPPTEVQPNARLDTVVIITDPSMVDVDYTPPEPASFDEYAAQVDTFPPLSDLLMADSALTGNFDTQAFVTSLPESIREAAESFFTDYNHVGTVSLHHINETCNYEELPLYDLGYQIHLFETPADARAAAQDERLVEIITGGNEFTQDVMLFSQLPLYTWDTTACDEASTAAVMWRQVGRAIIVTHSTFPNGSPVVANEWLDTLALGTYEPVFAVQLRLEASQ